MYLPCTYFVLRLPVSAHSQHDTQQHTEMILINKLLSDTGICHEKPQVDFAMQFLRIKPCS